MRALGLVVVFSLACHATPSVTPVPATETTPSAPPTATASAAPAAPTTSAATTSPTPKVATAPPTPTSNRAYTRCKAAPKPPPTPSSLREVDWCSLKVIPGYATLHDGRAEIHEYMELGGPHSTDIFLLGAVTYGDLDGDKQEEAIVVIDQESYAPQGSAFTISEIRVYAWKAGGPVSVATDRVARGADVEVKGGFLSVETVAGGTRCVEALKLGGGKLTPQGKPVCTAVLP